MMTDKKMNEIIVKVKSVWCGQIAVHEKYFSQAQQQNRGLKFVYKKESMSIPANLIGSSVASISAETYSDRYSTEKYHLVYFKWKPDVENQGSLF